MIASSKTLTFTLGFLGAVFMTGFWAATGRFEPVLLAFFGSCIGLNEGVSALKELAATRPPKDNGGSS